MNPDSARIRRSLTTALANAESWRAVMEISRRIDDAGMEDHDRLLAWDDYRRAVDRLRGSGWERNRPAVLPRRSGPIW